jgi:hypothetical protein
MVEKNNIDNLKPICHNCNLSIGTMNLSEYKKYLEDNLKSSKDKDLTIKEQLLEKINNVSRLVVNLSIIEIDSDSIDELSNKLLLEKIMNLDCKYLKIIKEQFIDKFSNYDFMTLVFFLDDDELNIVFHNFMKNIVITKRIKK